MKTPLIYLTFLFPSSIETHLQIFVRFKQIQRPKVILGNLFIWHAQSIANVLKMLSASTNILSNILVTDNTVDPFIMHKEKRYHHTHQKRSHENDRQFQTIFRAILRDSKELKQWIKISLIHTSDSTFLKMFNLWGHSSHLKKSSCNTIPILFGLLF